jgi:hypothetical protein
LLRLAATKLSSEEKEEFNRRWTPMNADEDDKNPIFICVFYLRPSASIGG